MTAAPVLTPDTPALATVLRATARGWRPFPLDHPSHPNCIGGRCRRERDEWGARSWDDPDAPTCAPGHHDKRGKHPTGHWPTQTATAQTAAMMRSWFGNAPVNVGIACKPSGLIVLDEDECDALSAFAAELGQTLPRTYRVRTSRGWHWYFSPPAGITLGNRTGTLKARHIDVRGCVGDGGYVVAAGSTHITGHVYVAEDESAPLAVLPAWIVEQIRAEAPRTDGEYAPGDIRSGTRAELLDTYSDHLRKVVTPGFENSFFTAARDGWRLVHLDVLDPETFDADMAAVIRETWSAPANKGDRRLIEQARRKALESPWKLRGEVLVLAHGNGTVPALPSDGPAPSLPPSAVTGAPPVDTHSDVATQGAGDATPSSGGRASLLADLTPYLSGEVVRTPTERGAVRDDDVPMLYAGKDHTVIGETEAGKSWLALACVVRELAAGRRVLYVHFEESDPAETVKRLRTMGCDVGEHYRAGRFAFAGVDVPVDVVGLGEMVDHAPALTVLDGVNAAMTLHGWDTNGADGAGLYRARLVAPFLAIGATTVSLDHVVKDVEKNRSGYAMGSVMKLNMVGGASFRMENRVPLKPGAVGRTSVYVVKDRPGSLRAVARTSEARNALWATMEVDSTTPVSVVRLLAPSMVDVDNETGPSERELKVLKIVRQLNGDMNAIAPPSTNEVKRAKGVRAADVPALLDSLERRGLVARETGAGIGTRWAPLESRNGNAVAPGTAFPDVAQGLSLSPMTEQSE